MLAAAINSETQYLIEAERGAGDSRRNRELSAFAGCPINSAEIFEMRSGCSLEDERRPVRPDTQPFLNPIESTMRNSFAFEDGMQNRNRPVKLQQALRPAQKGHSTGQSLFCLHFRTLIPIVSSEH